MQLRLKVVCVISCTVLGLGPTLNCVQIDLGFFLLDQMLFYLDIGLETSVGQMHPGATQVEEGQPFMSQEM